jgi:hypothetical protein
MEPLGQPEVRNPHRAVGIDQYIGWFQVQVGQCGSPVDAQVVHVVERLCDYMRNSKGLRQIKTAAFLQDFPQGPPLNVIHGNHEPVADPVRCVDAHDIGVRQPAHDPGTLHLTGFGFRTANHLQGDIAVEHRIASQVHVGKRARSQRLPDFVGSQAMAGWIALCRVVHR